MNFLEANTELDFERAQSATRRQVTLFVKRAFDVIGALVILLAIAPLMMIVALAIYLRDPGPVVFSHPRVGRKGKIFRCLKFRSMVQDAPERLKLVLSEDADKRKEWKLNQKLVDDPRILPTIGKALRRSSLDELPQLFNVLRGDMSLIGPRPCTLEELETHYGPSAHYYKMVRPGVSGLWQVSGRSRTTFEQRVAMDVDYVKHLTLGRDLWIAARTPGAVLSSDGAC